MPRERLLTKYSAPINPIVPPVGAVAAASGGDPPDDRQNEKPGRGHQKSRPVVPLSGDEDSDSEVARARAILRRHSAAKRRVKSGKGVSGARGGRAVRRSLRRSKGGPNYTPCLPCVRSLLRGPRGHCHKTMLPDASRCWECVTHNHTYVGAPALLLIAC